MSSEPRVSVVIIFLNAEQFIQEAIESVLNQSYPHWELLLVDDGSTDASTNIAREYARQRPEQISCLEHQGHVNRGMSSSRNLGVYHATGSYVAFLDADDLWLPHKLEEQVAILDRYQEVGMLYGETLYWHSWNNAHGRSQRDFVPPLMVEADTLHLPPTLLPLYLRGDAPAPCTCSIMVRRNVMLTVGGFEADFTNVYEDQVFYAKVCLATPIVAVNKCWDRYRQHPRSTMAIARKTEQEHRARLLFLRWLQNYLQEHDVQDDQVWHALQQELWRIEVPAWLPLASRSPMFLMWVKKWVLRIEDWLVPRPVSKWFWARRALAQGRKQPMQAEQVKAVARAKPL